MRNFNFTIEILEHIRFRTHYARPYFNIGLQLKEFNIFDFSFNLHNGV